MIDRGHAGPVEWRLLLVPPVPTLVGTLVVATVSCCRNVATQHRMLRRATAGVTVAAALITLSLADGAPPWRADLRLSRTPVWKVKQPALGNVESLIATDPPRGRTILMPPEAMMVLSMYTVEWHGVAPRTLYITSLQEPNRLKSARKILVRLASAEHPSPPPRIVEQSLQRLDVGTVCLSPTNHRGQASVRAAGFEPFADVGTLRCAFRATAGGSAGSSGTR